MNAVALSGITLGFGGSPVLKNVTLAISDNEFVGVLGANGAGKTTLMRAILGLVHPHAGSIAVLGRPATRGNDAIGYMPQSRTPSGAGLTGRAFVASAANGARWGLPLLGKDARREVDWALEIVGATELARRPLAELSGGERQRVLLAQALLGRPRLLLLDEPLINLDPNHQQSVVDLVRRVQQELRITVLFAAHELNPLLGALDRVLYLGNRHAALGTIDEVITGPVLSRLYGSAIDVVHLNDRFFVMSGSHEVEHDPHRHHHH